MKQAQCMANARKGDYYEKQRYHERGRGQCSKGTGAGS